MVSTAASQKNLWVAASDGDLRRVKELIEGGMSPNAKDSNSYTPMHAAASYAHLELLTYLMSVGGDINILDEEGETPLFTVETMEAAEYLVEHGAEVGLRNNDGQTAADFIEDDHPEIAQYLRSLLPSTASTSSAPAPIMQAEQQGPSALAMDNYAQNQASSLLEETQRIMRQAEETGENPDEKLREVVERAVREGMAWGGSGDGPDAGQGTVDGLIEEVKRRRED